MKILMVLMGLEIGGAETHVVELTKELVKRGNEVLVASNGGVYEQQLREYGVEHIWAPLHRRDPKCMLKSLRILDRVIRREKPGLVHAHARIPGFLCGLLHKKLKFPFITSAHWVFEVSPLLRLMTDWGQRSVAVSEDIKQYLMDSYDYPEDQIHVTINGIDTDSFKPEEGSNELKAEFALGNGPIVCTVSRLDESREEASRKLIALAPELCKQVPDAQILIVGGGNCEDALRREAEEANRILGRNAVVMTGARTDVSRFVALCDVFVGVSRAALEAMSAEKPTILAGNEGYIGVVTPENLGAARESNFCCRGFSPIDQNVLLNDLIGLLTDSPENRRGLGQFGRTVILREYSVARMTDDYQAAYRRLLQRPVAAAISGYYGFENLGDDAVLLAISKELKQLPIPVRLTVFSQSPKETTRQYGLPAVSRFSPFKVIKTLRNSDILISGGGSLLQDKTSTRSLIYYLTIIRLAQLMGKPVFLYANGIGPLSRPRNRRLVQKCIRNCDAITLRDGDSLEELMSLGIAGHNLCVTGDPALKLGAYAPKVSLTEYGISRERAVVGVSVRNIPDIGEFPQECAKLCDRLIREKQCEVIFLVMQESEDMALAERIRSMMEETSHLVSTPGEPLKMLGLIREMDAIFAMRLHAAIFAAGVNVPVVGCVYDPKVNSFLNMMDMPSCGTPREMTAEKAYPVFEDVLTHREAYKVGLQEKVEALLPQTEETVRRFKKLLIDAKLAEEDFCGKEHDGT